MKKFQLAAMFAVAIVVSACGKKESAEPVVEEATAPTCIPLDLERVGGITIVEIVPGLSSKMTTSGCGEVAQVGHVAVVHYTGWFQDSEAEDGRGAKFDSSVDRGQHFKFPLGGARVIRGWDLGVEGMQVGEVRELTIAPELAYGDSDRGPIPGGSTLIFEVELAGLEGTPAAEEVIAEEVAAEEVVEEAAAE